MGDVVDIAFEPLSVHWLCRRIYHTGGVIVGFYARYVALWGLKDGGFLKIVEV